MSGRKRSARPSRCWRKAPARRGSSPAGNPCWRMMNLRLASPALLIDIAPADGVGGGGGRSMTAVTLGAGVTHAAIEDGRVPDPSRGLMPQAAASLAYRAIRNRGTIGGSLALADPAAEWPAVLAALDAEAIRLRPGRPARAALRRIRHAASTRPCSPKTRSSRPCTSRNCRPARAGAMSSSPANRASSPTRLRSRSRTGRAGIAGSCSAPPTARRWC